ncbi:MAG: radical SAM protein [Lachnospiraceae bacterium]|nr:radical SAM protein [Lachnospiraceae bacterium]
MIREERINSKKLGALTLPDLSVFFAKTGCMIINPATGTTLCVEKEVAEDLLCGRISDDLAFVLVQRALARVDDSRPFVEEVPDAKPNFFLIDITNCCNLNCTYCFRDLKESRAPMTEGMLKNICSKIASYASANPGMKVSVQVWGGEPLLEPDKIWEMRQIFDEEDARIDLSIETNGTLITEEKAKQLKEHRVRVGISIDGDELIQNLQRPMKNGNDSYQPAAEGIEAMRKAGNTDFGTITVVTGNTADRIEEILDHMVKRLGIRNLKFNLMRENDRNLGLSIKEDAIGDYLDRLIEKLRKLHEDGCPVCESNIRQRLRNLLLRADDNICDARGCQGGYRMISVDAEGKVYPCELTDVDEFAIGRILDGEETDFAHMVESAAKKKEGYFKTRDTGECRNCAWWYYCRGGCRSAAYFAEGSVSPVDRISCRYNKELYPRLVRLILDEPDFVSALM